MSLSITGTGSALPALIVTNTDLAKTMDTSDEWISTRTGIKERRICTGETSLELSLQSARAALDDCGCTAGELDYIICCTIKSDFLTPSLACALQKELGGGCSAVCFDINAACAGFLYAIDLADALVASGKAKKILIVCTELLSRCANWNDRSTCVLFGDGSGAVVVERGDGLLAVTVTTDGSTKDLNAPDNANSSPFAVKKSDEPSCIWMNGKEVYKFAVSAIHRDIKTVLDACGKSSGDIKYFIIHQANKRIIEAARERLGEPEQKFPTNIERRGNTSAASIPILLDELNRSGGLSEGDLLAVSGFGAGFTTGACVFKWTKRR